MFNIAHPKGEDLIAQMLDLALNQDDPERSYVKFKQGDELVLLVNNQGGMSVLEMCAIVDEVLTQLGEYSSVPNFPFSVLATDLVSHRITLCDPRTDLQRHIHGLDEHARLLALPDQLDKHLRVDKDPRGATTSLG